MFQSYLTGIEIEKAVKLTRSQTKFQSYLTGIEITFGNIDSYGDIIVPIVPYWN